LRDLDLTTLRLFVSVCETGNIARAGERPASSARPSASGWPSWKNRSARRCWCASATAWCRPPAGQTLLEHARGMLDAARPASSATWQTYAGGARGQVRILASVSAMTESLADDVAGFLQEPAHRSIHVDMEERVSPEIVRGVREGLASLGVCWDAADLERATPSAAIAGRAPRAAAWPAIAARRLG
jgi:DNA-binding transcriptional LysR family regulator